MARPLQRWVALIALSLVGCQKQYEPQSFFHNGTTPTQPGQQLRFECWEDESDCETDASHRCGTFKGSPRGFKIVGRSEHASDGGRKLIVLDVQCTP
jgi:hypothetical protein